VQLPRTKRAARGRKARRLDADGLTAILEPEKDGCSAASIAERSNASYNQCWSFCGKREQAGDSFGRAHAGAGLWRRSPTRSGSPPGRRRLAARA